MRKTQILKNKPVYLGLSILDLSKSIVHEFCYDCVKPKYGENAKLCYWIQAVSLFMQKQMIFTKLLQKMLKQDLSLQILK